MVVIPPRNYAIIENPVVLDSDGEPTVDGKTGQVILRHGEREVRLHQSPFPLYPGEILCLKDQVAPLKVVYTNTALKLRANTDFVGKDGEEHVAGDEWLFEGPGAYIPNVNEDIIGEIKAQTLKDNQALRLRAKQDTIARDGQKRVTGEEWLVRKRGAYLPGVYEEIIKLVTGHVQTDAKALHVRALRSFTDQFKQKRKNGEEWLVTKSMAESYIPSVYEEVIRPVAITILNNRQYCVIVDPFDPKTGTNSLGK
eukprot:UN31007